MNNLKLLGIDLAKSVFQLYGVDTQGRRVLSKRLRRESLLAFMAQLPSCTVVMEACGGAHYWARQIHALGHTARLIAAQYVKPYVQGNKNDRNDAAAICEAARNPAMRYVAPKSIEQQDIQALHRVREQVMKQRTALSNELRGLLAEYGIVISQGMAALRRCVPTILEDAENGLTDRFRGLLAGLYEQLGELDKRRKQYDRQLHAVFQQTPLCQQLVQQRGVGELTATAFVATVGDPRVFKNGRHVAAWLGMVPRHRASGTRCQVQGISKRGDRYLRSLLIHGARAVVRYAEGKTDPLSVWVMRIQRQKGTNVAAVALANKNARVLWAMMAQAHA